MSDEKSAAAGRKPLKREGFILHTVGMLSMANLT